MGEAVEKDGIARARHGPVAREPVEVCVQTLPELAEPAEVVCADSVEPGAGGLDVRRGHGDGPDSIGLGRDGAEVAETDRRGGSHVP